ncbi:MAG: DUF4302 domain-containing protein [Proteiniphilum sp.]|nr:DUF4302 domain-containing protein [Proteiniphilum sp.]
MIILAIGLSQACTPETELLFDKPASERMSETLKNYQELLVSDSNGWIVEYYPHSSRTYGGFNLFFQFTEKEVTVKTELESSILTVDKATSSYSLGQDMGPTLNFNSYNEILNYFSDPALPVGGGAGFGLEGDYEFVFMSGNASEIILRGKKTQNTIRLTPISAENWEKYREDAVAMKSTFGAPAYVITVNGKELTSITKPTPAYNRFVVTYEENEESVTANVAYVTTPTGIRLYEPLTIDGVTVQDFTFNAASEQMESLDGTVVIKQVFPPLEDVFINSLSSSRWFLSSGAMGSGFLPSFNAIKSGINAIGEDLAFAWIGISASTSKPSFTFGSYDGSSVWYGSNLLDFTKVEGEAGRLKITVTSVYEVNWAWYLNYVPALGQFAALLGGEYIITTTSPRDNISSFTLTNPVNAEKTLTLVLEQVTFP